MAKDRSVGKVGCGELATADMKARVARGDTVEVLYDRFQRATSGGEGFVYDAVPGPEDDVSKD